jgi:glutamate racemase
VIEPAVREALRVSENGVIGVMGTEATVRSGAYEKALRALGGEREIRVVSVPCPLLVPLVENGYVGEDCLITRLALEEYLAPIREAGADTVILGCTHYPLIRGAIAKAWGKDRLINTGLEAAKEVKRLLQESENCNDSKEKGELRLYSSDATEGFGTKAKLFLPEATLTEFERVDILSYGL